MFERFTHEARESVVRAQAEARSLRHGYIGTEHLLLGILAGRAEGVGARALGLLGFHAGELRDVVSREIGPGPGGLGPREAQALEGIGIDLEEVRLRTEEAFGPGSLDRPAHRPRRRPRRRECVGEEPTRGHIPFCPRTKKVLEISLREARRLGDRHIGSEHLLLAIVREGRGVAARVLTDRGATPDVVRAALERVSREADPPSASA